MNTQRFIQQTIDAFNKHNIEAFVDAYASDANSYDPQYENPLRGLDAIRKDIADFFSAFPDVQVELISPIMINGNTAAFEVEVTGTHNGPLLSPGGDFPSTGNRISFRAGRFIYLNPEGKIQSDNRYYDMMSIMTQLGLMSENV